MWEKIKNFWKSVNLLEESWNKSIEMLETCEIMFQQAHQGLRVSKKTFNIEQLRKDDKQINKLLREIRKNVVIHLSVHAPKGLPEGLVLISIAIDIERIGDYCKNIADLATRQTKKLAGGLFNKQIKEIEAAILDSFPRVKTCLDSGAAPEALTLLKAYNHINKLCDSLIIEIIREKDKTLTPGNSASLALYLRWLKRLNSHLRNITTGIVNPFHRIGFKTKKKLVI
jgi:phosphate transport system protein